VPDADATFNQAVAAGAQVKMPLADMFWGDRYGMVTDPFGHQWSIATHQRDMTSEEMMAEMTRGHG
jgi:PhnB protein